VRAIVGAVLPSTVVGVKVCCTPFTQTSLIVIGVVPVFWKVSVIVSPFVNTMFVICPCSVAMKLKLSAPIHAATAMLTATVTAMRMIDATTGLRAFLLLVFIFLFIPPFWTGMYAREVRDLNLTTYYTIFDVCRKL
jgi:hypothetical protein